jgi:hypothetical protein
VESVARKDARSRVTSIRSGGNLKGREGEREGGYENEGMELKKL